MVSNAWGSKGILTLFTRGRNSLCVSGPSQETYSGGWDWQFL